jgi:hypothetical protein
MPLKHRTRDVGGGQMCTNGRQPGLSFEARLMEDMEIWLLWDGVLNSKEYLPTALVI